MLFSIGFAVVFWWCHSSTRNNGTGEFGSVASKQSGRGKMAELRDHGSLNMKCATTRLGSPLAPKLVLVGQLQEQGGDRATSPATETARCASELCNYFFAPCPISTWEQCKLFKTRFSGLAIIIMMISISVTIASDYLAGNFAAWGQRGLHGSWRIASLGQREKETRRQRRGGCTSNQ